MQQSLRMLLLSPQSLMGFAGTPKIKTDSSPHLYAYKKISSNQMVTAYFWCSDGTFVGVCSVINAVASNSITITSHIPPLCKIASAQFCNRQITNTVSHNKKEQIPNGTCSFLVLGRDCVEAHFVIKHYHG